MRRLKECASLQSIFATRAPRYSLQSPVQPLQGVCPSSPTITPRLTRFASSKASTRCPSFWRSVLVLMSITPATCRKSLGPDEWIEPTRGRSEEHTSELQSHSDLVCRLLLEKKRTSVYAHVA